MEKEFPFTEVFEIKNTKSILNSQVEFGSGCTPYITAAEGNNGLAGYVSCPGEWVDEGDCVFIGGKTMTVFYQAEDFCSNDSHNLALYPKTDESLSRGTYLYLVSAIKKELSEKYTWGNSISFKKIVKETISLPVVPSTDPNHEYTRDDIDWAYMERYIAELEQERIAELDAYLKAAGLDDCALTAEDEAALAEQPVFAKFKASDLFEIKKGKRLTKADMLPGNIPFIGASADNNGVTAHIGNTEHLHPGNTFTVSYNGSVGEVFLQDEQFWASDDVNVWYPRFEFSRGRMLYVMSVVKKFGQRHDYNAKWTIDVMREETLSLPVTPHSDPSHSYTRDDIDWAYMERCIRAIEKQVVAGVVEYKDKVIETTRKVIGEV